MKTKPMLSCGHAANATDGEGNPTCAIHFGLAEVKPAKKPNLNGRVARCDCGNTKPSTLDGSLAFFAYRKDAEFDSYYCGCWGWD